VFRNDSSGYTGLTLRQFLLVTDLGRERALIPTGQPYPMPCWRCRQRITLRPDRLGAIVCQPCLDLLAQRATGQAVSERPIPVAPPGALQELDSLYF